MSATAFAPGGPSDALETLDASIAAWLTEDLGSGDVTSEAIVPAEARCRAEIRLEEPGVVCGLAVARRVFAALDPAQEWTELVGDGGFAEPGPIAVVDGRARAVLAGERLALNLLGRLSGIATRTRAFVEAVEGTGAAILDTRKTTPGLRALEKWAVRCGGGTNHRFGLFDGILIKDTHRRLVGGVGPAVRAALATGLPVEVECETLDEVGEALAAGASRILLDNMAVADLRRAVELVAGRAWLEASGGMTLDTVRAVADTGVDAISVGSLTHGARSLAVSLEVVELLKVGSEGCR
ncbi:MAG: nicotinate-nucleotide diphosphorylase (carboxylating) [Chloroflexota bacterium]